MQTKHASRSVSRSIRALCAAALCTMLQSAAVADPPRHAPQCPRETTAQERQTSEALADLTLTFNPDVPLAEQFFEFSIARQELDFARGLCDHPPGTLIAVERTADADGIRERFRVVSDGAA